MTSGRRAGLRDVIASARRLCPEGSGLAGAKGIVEPEGNGGEVGCLLLEFLDFPTSVLVDLVDDGERLEQIDITGPDQVSMEQLAVGPI